jgi:hypothetical protein
MKIAHFCILGYFGHLSIKLETKMPHLSKKYINASCSVEHMTFAGARAYKKLQGAF